MDPMGNEDNNFHERSHEVSIGILVKHMMAMTMKECRDGDHGLMKFLMIAPGMCIAFHLSIYLDFVDR